jgi:GNAT superfamily N-acetyltransferase
VASERLPILSGHSIAPTGPQTIPESEPSRLFTLPPKQPGPTKRPIRLQGARTPREYDISSFTPGDLDELAVAFKDAFKYDVPVEQIRRGLAYRYIENPFTGLLQTGPLVARHEGPRGSLIGFLGSFPSPVLIRGEERIAAYSGDFFVRNDYRGGGLARALFRTYMTTLTDIGFTSSAGFATQAICKYYNVIPLLQYTRRWTLAVDRIGPLRSSIDLPPIRTITDMMVNQAAEHTAGASFRLQRTRTYLEWRFGPAIMAADPECELLDLSDRGRSIGWIVAKRREAMLGVLDWFVPQDRYDEALRRVCEHARSRHCNMVTGRGMQPALHSSALALGAVEYCDEMDYWTWGPDPSVYDGIDWDQAYLSRTDGDDTLPWNLGPIDSGPLLKEPSENDHVYRKDKN